MDTDSASLVILFEEGALLLVQPFLRQLRLTSHGVKRRPSSRHRQSQQTAIAERPKPPFIKQEVIEWPGLTSQMNPRPDHGEDSFAGSGKLMGRRAIIAGGDSGIGCAVAIAFPRAGADVVIG